MTSSDITVMPPRAGTLARPKKAKPAATGSQLIGAELSTAVVAAMVDSERFRIDVQRDDGLGVIDHQPHPRTLDCARPFHRARLPEIVRAVEVSRVLLGIACVPMRSVAPADADAMLQFLFGAMGKRRGDEAAAKLAACSDIFSHASNALGSALGLWKPAPRHPVILALAIKHLMAAKTFEPAESELREALGKVQQQLQVHRHYTEQWLDKLDHADNTVFALDRPAWDAAYADVPAAVASAMQERLFGEEPGEEEDDDGNIAPPSPRWQALADLVEAKEAAKPLREAACKTAPARRTRKPSGKADGD